MQVSRQFFAHPSFEPMSHMPPDKAGSFASYRIGSHLRPISTPVSQSGSHQHGPVQSATFVLRRPISVYLFFFFIILFPFLFPFHSFSPARLMNLNCSSRSSRSLSHVTPTVPLQPLACGKAAQVQCKHPCLSVTIQQVVGHDGWLRGEKSCPKRRCVWLRFGGRYSGQSTRRGTQF